MGLEGVRRNQGNRAGSLFSLKSQIPVGRARLSLSLFQPTPKEVLKWQLVGNKGSISGTELSLVLGGVPSARPSATPGVQGMPSVTQGFHSVLGTELGLHM